MEDRPSTLTPLDKKDSQGKFSLEASILHRFDDHISAKIALS